MNKRLGARDLIAFIPYRIEPDQYERSGPLLAGFPRNILLPRVERSDSGEVLTMLTRHQQEIQAKQDRKLEAAREQRKNRRQRVA